MAQVPESIDIAVKPYIEWTAVVLAVVVCFFGSFLGTLCAGILLKAFP